MSVPIDIPEPTNNQASEVRKLLIRYGVEFPEQLSDEIFALFAAEKDRLIDELISKLPEKQPMQPTPEDAWTGTVEPAISLAKQEGFNKALEIVTQLLLECREAK